MSQANGTQPVLLRRREGSVEILTLNRPQRRNALNPELLDKLGAALEQAEQCAHVRVIVLTATGDRAFCAGMDLKAFAEQSGGGSFAFHPWIRVLFDGQLNKPVVAAINGTALAGGFELMLCCDLAVAAEPARFGIPEVKFGLFAAGGGVLLPSRIPLAVALELGLTGETIDAQRAYRLGLVNRVVMPNQLLPTALALARTIAENAPLALATTKKLMWACARDGAQVARDSVQAAMDQVFGSEDAREGATAFSEKRSPRWKGR